MLKIWVLADNRAGNRSQIIGLAQKISKNFEIKTIKYNYFIKIPNFLKFGFLIGITKETKKDILSNKDIPNIIISAGRRSAILSAYLKKKFPNIYNIHLMNPNLSFAKFDHIILPNHDNNVKQNHTNISYINGALSLVNKQSNEQYYQKHHKFFAKFSKPVISVLIGGDSKNKVFSQKDIEKFLKLCQNISQKYNCQMLFLNSRRTNKKINNFLKNFLEENFEHNVCHYQDINSHEIYLASLYKAKIIIVTGDSISMCSEICLSGKYILIYGNKDFCSKKHLRFSDFLFKNNHAQKLSSTIKLIKNKKLNEIDMVTQKIIKDIKINKSY